MNTKKWVRLSTISPLKLLITLDLVDVFERVGLLSSSMSCSDILDNNTLYFLAPDARATTAPAAATIASGK